MSTEKQSKIIKNPLKLPVPKVVANLLFISSILYGIYWVYFSQFRSLYDFLLKVVCGFILSNHIRREKWNMYVPIGFACMALDGLLSFPSNYFTGLCAAVYIIESMACCIFTMTCKMGKFKRYREKLEDLYGLLAMCTVGYMVVRLILLMPIHKVHGTLWFHLLTYMLAVLLLLTWLVFPEGVPVAAITLPKAWKKGGKEIVPEPAQEKMTQEAVKKTDTIMQPETIDPLAPDCTVKPLAIPTDPAIGNSEYKK